MKIKGYFLALMCLGSIVAQAQKPMVVAHRGYWKGTHAGQNTIASLLKADSARCEASEFDVWITQDNVLVLHHDETINHLSLEMSTAKEVMAQRNKEGFYIPTLDAFLNAAKTLDTHLVCELKPHQDKKREKLAVKSIINMVKEKGLRHRISYISFSLYAVKQFIKMAPKGTAVYYLNGDLSPQQLKKIGAAGLDYHLSVLKKYPEWIKDCERMGMKAIAWTINKKEDMQWCIDNKVDMITTDQPLLLQKEIEKRTK